MRGQLSVEEIQNHIVGDLSFLRPKAVKLLWFPYNCKYERFSKDRIFDMKETCFPSKNITLSVIGDSTVRSIYCGLFRAMTVGENSFLPESLARIAGCGFLKAKRGMHSFSLGGINVEYHSTAVLGDMSKVKPIFPIGKNKFTDGNRPLLKTIHDTVLRKPDLILLHSAGWEFREIGLANIRNIKLSKSKVVEIYDRNIYLMSEGMKSVLKILRDETYEGIFFWRNAMCNTRFDAEIFENKRFDDIIYHANFEVFDSFELSRGRIEAMHDGYHFDRPREEKRPKIEENYIKHEELNALFTNFVLNRLFEGCQQE